MNSFRKFLADENVDVDDTEGIKINRLLHTDVPTEQAM
jgi:hypothetical protein